MADPWPHYLAAHVDIDFADGRQTFVPAAPVALPEGLSPPLWIITACNPGGAARSEAVNRRENRRLLGAVQAAGWRHWPAVGRNAEATWQEASFAVEAPGEAILALARRFRQDAVFRLDGGGLGVVGCAVAGSAGATTAAESAGGEGPPRS